MTTTIHINALGIPALGAISVQVTTSGDPVDEVVVTRRVVGATATTAVVIPASLASSAGNLAIAGGSVSFLDTTAPTETAVEYLAGVVGVTPALASNQVTLTAGTNWWLGCPARPYLNILMLRGSMESPCSTTPMVVLNRIGEESSTAASVLTQIDNQASPTHWTKLHLLPTYELGLITRTEADRDLVRAIVAPGEILCLRPPGNATYGLSVVFVSVRSVVEARVSTDHRKTWRQFTISVQEVEQPVLFAYGSSGGRFADLCDVYATYALLEAAGVSWADVASGIAGGTFPASFLTCAEVAALYASCTALTATGKTSQQLVAGL